MISTAIGSTIISYGLTYQYIVAYDCQSCMIYSETSMRAYIWCILVTSNGGQWRLKLPVNQVQPFVKTNNKETPRVRVAGPLLEGSTGDRWFPFTKGQ